MYFAVFRTLLIGLILCLYTTAHGQDSSLPNIGGFSAGQSLEEERQIGQAIMRNLRRAGALLEEPQINAYINQLGYRLLSAHNETLDPFHFFIVDDKGINAFALPGGYIGVNYGLILASDSEDELAAVLAHEIAHVTQRHHARAYAHRSTSQIPLIAAIIAAAIIGDSQIGQAAIAGSLALNIEQQLSFTRSNEQEADRIGISLLAKAGMDPNGMARFFKRLDDQARLYGPQAPEFLRTHPVNSNRITDAQHRASQIPLQKPTDKTHYELTRIHLEFLKADKSDQVKNLLEKYHNAVNQTQTNEVYSLQYGYVLALIENSKHKQAYEVAKQLDKTSGNYLSIKLAKTKALFNIDSAQALIKYKELLQLYPDNPAVIDDYTEALLNLNMAEQAQHVLNQFLKTQPENPLFYQRLAKTEAALKNSAASHQAMAEYYYQVGQMHDAIKQLELALKSPKLDFYRLNQLEARLSELKEEFLQLKEIEKQL